MLLKCNIETLCDVMSQSACLNLYTRCLFYNPAALHTNATFPGTFRDLAVSPAVQYGCEQIPLIFSFSL